MRALIQLQHTAASMEVSWLMVKRLLRVREAKHVWVGSIAKFDYGQGTRDPDIKGERLEVISVSNIDEQCDKGGWLGLGRSNATHPYTRQCVFTE
jgi:hypothetical protein